jgi:hypothetical protein
MHIQGTAFRAAFGATYGINPTAWSVPATVPFTVNYDTSAPIGTATLTQAEDGSITVDVVLAETNRPLTAARPYLGVCLYGGSPTNTVMCVGLIPHTNDSQLPPWSEVT